MMTKLTYLASSVVVAGVLLTATLLTLLTIAPPTLAQSPNIIITKTLNRNSNVVRVGEILSFTIMVTNNTSTFTLSNVTLFDNYDQTIMAFAGAVPPHDIHVAGSGMITWTNVATPVIPPGQGISVTVVFTVEHPQPATVNRVEGKDIREDKGGSLEGANTDETQDAIGGNAPILKMLSPLTTTPQAGLPVTFSHIISNDGAALMTFLPLTDTYDPAFLQFKSAVPTPSIISPGQLVWTDLTTYFGDLLPFKTVVVTTVFTATTQVITTVNQASTQGARDQYNNNLAGGLALVPIFIIGDPNIITDTTDNNDSDSNNNNNDDNDDDDDSIVAPAQPTATATTVAAAIVATATVNLINNQTVITEDNAPLFLPETGYRAIEGYYGVVVILLLLGVLGYLFRNRD